MLLANPIPSRRARPSSRTSNWPRTPTARRATSPPLSSTSRSTCQKRADCSDTTCPTAGGYFAYVTHDIGVNLDDAIRAKSEHNAHKYPLEKSRGPVRKYDRL